MQVTFLGDVESPSVLDLHCSTSHRGEAPVGQQVARVPAADLRSLAGDRAFDPEPLRNRLRGDRIRPLIPHREVPSLKRAHNARIDRTSYNRRWMIETAISTIKRTLGAAGRARSWSLEPREMLLKAAVYDIQTALMGIIVASRRIRPPTAVRSPGPG